MGGTIPVVRGGQLGVTQGLCYYCEGWTGLGERAPERAWLETLVGTWGEETFRGGKRKFSHPEDLPVPYYGQTREQTDVPHEHGQQSWATVLPPGCM